MGVQQKRFLRRVLLSFMLVLLWGNAAIAAFKGVIIQQETDSTTNVPTLLNHQRERYKLPPFFREIPGQFSDLSSSPEFSFHFNYYDITGNSLEELVQQMIVSAPLRREDNGSAFAASTQWQVDWNYRPRPETTGGCMLNTPKVSLEVTTTLPRLQVGAGIDPSVLKEWKRYINALKDHEDGHRQHGIHAAHEVLHLLETEHPSVACRKLVDKINKGSQQIVAQYRQKDQDYDRQTGHGLTQGAVFNRFTS